MPLFDEEATAKLNALLDHGAQTQRQIDALGEKIAALGVNINALYKAVLKQSETMQLIIEDQQQHKNNPDAHENGS